ncbi:uncharacterized protein N7473_013189 [Penicillium subrubescens]|uniref:Uncharacterized protein n=1 Tax=Penicillium subrubescens TaxID=1316194 RepID=A0A1Q5ST80_9EURO|nr:uncharacterized protein N7473_013189 [Penicillium subrubescens]KAJ5873630.1 hypothetical protein N7473_013189 [Penicillium subrubescens]OKO91126.1 hypothetical protein PENSUB_13115 [Penicillium subrubescens]
MTAKSPHPPEEENRHMSTLERLLSSSEAPQHEEECFDEKCNKFLGAVNNLKYHLSNEPDEPRIKIFTTGLKDLREEYREFMRRPKINDFVLNSLMNALFGGPPQLVSMRKKDGKDRETDDAMKEGRPSF